jgi:predicted HAD superfamily phosphohydrolase YqeG
VAVVAVAAVAAAGRGRVSGAYERVTSLAELFARVRELALATLIFDIEPLVAPWDGGRPGLDRGVAEILGQAETLPSVQAVVFSTNSARRPSHFPPAPPGLRVEYVASAAKPLRTAPYRDLPRPGAVIGDQLPTDGILAYRLGYLFLHYDPPYGHVPIGPRLMHRWGRAVRPVLFGRQPPP